MDERAPDEKTTALAPVQPARAAVTAYLTQYKTDCSLSTIISALRTLARLLPEFGTDDPFQFPWHMLRYETTCVLVSRMAGKYGVRHQKKLRYVLKGVLDSCVMSNIMSADDFHRATHFKSPRTKNPPAGRMLTPEEKTALFAAAANRPTPEREYRLAILALFLGVGSRRMGLVHADVSDWHPTTRSVRLRMKGGEHKEIPVPPNAAAFVEAWLNVRGRDPGALFPTIYPSSNGKSISLDKRHMNARTMNRVIDRIREEAGVEHFVPHDFRRTFISELKDAGADPQGIADMVGHDDLRSQDVYDKRGLEVARRVADQNDIPFVPTAALPSGKKPG